MKSVLLFLITLLILSCYSISRAATNPEEGQWNLFLLKAKINQKFSFIGEYNFRSEKMISTFNYSEFKGSVLYSVSKHLSFSAGAGGFKKGTEDVIFSSVNSETEFRTWIDFFWFKHSLGRFNLEHRGRLEQRFIPSNYQNRLRYRMLVNVPVNHRQMANNTLFFSSYNEFFVGENNPAWEKNKFYGGAGYRLNEHLSVQLGNVVMTDIKKTSTTGKNYLLLTVFYTI